MAFFGIGKSGKKEQVSEGVIHDSKQETQEGEDILAEFEKQFSGPLPEQNTGSVPGEVPPVQASEAPGADTHEAFQPPQSEAQPPEQTRTEPHDPFGSQQSARPLPTAPQNPPQSPPPSAQWPENTPAVSTSAASDDLPEFDFDFHPSESVMEDAPREAPEPQRQTAQQPSGPRPPSPPPAPLQSSAGSSDQRSPSGPQAFPRLPSERQPRSDFLDAFETHHDTNAFEHDSRPSWLEGKEMGNAPDPFSSRPPSQPAPPEPAKPEHPDVVMRDGMLFIEKHALARHLTDLGSLRGLSDQTSGQFTRIDTISREEKKLFAKMRASIETLQTSLEHTDELLFSGD